jgi:hypothetical protein
MKKQDFGWKNRGLTLSFKLLLITLIGLIIPFGVTKLEPMLFASNQVFISKVNAQSISPEAIAAIVYERIPELPKENQYHRQKTGEQDLDNTLVSRLVRYHQYVKARPTIFRLDWKLTLADYLGINEIIPESRYPGYSTLKTNPLPKDKEAINSLTRSQRLKFVDVLVSIYNGDSKGENAPNSESSPTNTRENNSSNNSPSPNLVLPQPGAADLLK